MITIDHIAYKSQLRGIDPLFKLLLSTCVLFICLFANSYLVSLITIVIMSLITVKYGGTPFVVLLKLMLLPLSFLIISAITIVIQRADSTDNFIFFIKGIHYYYGLNILSLDFALRIFLRALAAISCMYFLSCTTPITELSDALKKLKVSKLFIELVELIYRFIFVLGSTANQIYFAQSSRAGYNGLGASFKSLGILVSMLFTRSYQRSEKIYIALESRGYNGELDTVEIVYKKNKLYYIYGFGFIVLLCLVAFVERVLF